MKHAGADALEALGVLLEQVRCVPNLKERNPGVFYLKSSAFLHFHDDPAGLFADVRIDGEWQRYRVSTKAEQRRLAALIRGIVA